MVEDNRELRTRFAPSPTGDLHIGGARTALFNFLLAKKNKGSFILRVEDTDIKRSSEHYAIEQYNDLLWLGIIPDESPFNFSSKEYGPYKQKLRINVYNKYLSMLLSFGKAYRCFCSKSDIEKERKEYIEKEKKLDYKYSRKCKNLSSNVVSSKLANGEKFSIRFFVENDREYSFDDLIRGSVVFSGNDVEDFVICRENGIPLLNFAVVIDDHLMKISHVMRAEEHLTNTAKQIAIYEAFGWEHPIYSHLSIIINDQKKKISKRDDNGKFQVIKSLRNLGYLPEGIVNYLLFLGWNPKNTKNEYFSIREAIDVFDIENINHRSPIFSVDKMNWFNNYWIRKIEKKRFDVIAWKFLKEHFSLEDKHRLKGVKVANLFRNQICYFSELINLCSFFFYDLTQRDEIPDDLEDNFTDFCEKLLLLKKWKKDLIEETLLEETKNLERQKRKSFFLSLRKMITGIEKGPEISSVIELIGKREFKKRIKKNIFLNEKK